MKRQEALALVIASLILFGMPAAIVAYQYWWRPIVATTRVIDIKAAAPEAGGFQPSAIRVKAGETVTLRFSSVDVTHGIAIGPGLGIDLGHVDPGRVKEVTLTFDRAGTYTFYCNSWCSPDHWRMRGIVEVRDPSNPNALPSPRRDPVIDALIAEGVNIDATHTAQNGQDAGHELRWVARPSAVRGAAAINTLAIPAELRDETWQRSHSPAEAIAILAAANPAVTQTVLDDVIAYVWVGENLTSERRDEAAALYSKNCAACHGPTGNGDGPAANLTVVEPVSFADPAHMVQMRSDVLYAKIRRGGMGTDMPNFGTLFTPEETWALVDYLWTFILESEETGPQSN